MCKDIGAHIDYLFILCNADNCVDSLRQMLCMILFEDFS